ncbi:MAG: CBS domain-containing protein [Acidobacteriota bacterium]
MRVEEVMRHEAVTCAADATLIEAGRTMARVGCGMLPVVDAARRVIGVLTDRDICCALTGEDRDPGALRARGVMTRDVVSCRREDDVSSALATMRLCRVRRLPVIDRDGHLEGVLSLDEIVLRAGVGGPSAEEIVATLRSLSEHAVPACR